LRLAILDGNTLTQDAVRSRPASFCLLEHGFGGVEPPEQDQCPRLAEQRRSKGGALREQ
jgi:hypothetical protein